MSEEDTTSVKLSKSLTETVLDAASNVSSSVEHAVGSFSSGLGDYVSTVGYGVGSAVQNVSYGVGSAVQNVSYGVGSAVQNISYGVGGTVHNVTSSVKRILTTPPQTLDPDERRALGYILDDESPGSVVSTPKLSPSNNSFMTDISDGNSMQDMEAALNVEIGINEDYFSKPEGCESTLTGSEVEESIEKCKALILECDENSTRRRTLVHKLVKLRLCLQTIQEETELTESGIQVILGHQFKPYRVAVTKAKHYCDKCAQVIWGLLHMSYLCILCGFHCHHRCIKSIHRKCVSQRLVENPNYELRICPEVGLSDQDYRCAECGTLITNNHPRGLGCFGDIFLKETAWSEPRRCDYSGRYYCPACHWNSRQILPARVVHNWDFEERHVSRQAKQLLMIMKVKPNLDIEQLNPYLTRFVEELTTVKNLRIDILKMKPYLATCRVAQEEKLLLRLSDRQHFVDGFNMYSLQDLIDINSGQLLDYLREVHDIFIFHIRTECIICQGKGYICEVCQSKDIIYPFDKGVHECDRCSAVYHDKCFGQRKECSKCVRQEARKVLVS